MAIIPNAVKTKGAGVFVAAGGRGRGFRVEPAGVYPVPTFPVLVRMHVDANGTKRDLLTSASGARWPDHGFAKLELEGGDNMEWTVTVYETNSDWDENPPTQLVTVRNTSPGVNIPTGPVALSVVAMRPTFQPAGSMTGGVAELRSTTMAVPCLVAGPTGTAWPLKAGADGRLLVSTVPTAPVSLGSGVVSKNPGSGVAEELLNAPIDTSGYRGGVVLRIGPVTFYGGTTPTVRASIRSLKSHTVGGTTTDYLAGEFAGAEVGANGAGEISVGLLVPSSTAGTARTATGYVMRAQPVLTFTGAPVGYSVPWELWGLP